MGVSFGVRPHHQSRLRRPGTAGKVSGHLRREPHSRRRPSPPERTRLDLKKERPRCCTTETVPTPNPFPPQHQRRDHPLKAKPLQCLIAHFLSTCFIRATHRVETPVHHPQSKITLLEMAQAWTKLANRQRRIASLI